MLWTVNLPAITSGSWQGLGPGRPTLSSTQLCVSDNVDSVVMYDTGAGPTSGAPTYKWTYSIGGDPQYSFRSPPPVVANGTVYLASWISFRSPTMSYSCGS